MIQAQEKAPGSESKGLVNLATTSVPNAGAYFTDAALHVAGAYVAVVHTAHGKHRRRVFLTLSSAQSAVDRAIEAGHEADVVLCRLVPVTGGVAL